MLALETEQQKAISRRRLLLTGGAAAVGLVIAGCAPGSLIVPGTPSADSKPGAVVSPTSPPNHAVFFKTLADNIYLSATIYPTREGWNTGTLSVVLGEGRFVKTPDVNIDWPVSAEDVVTKSKVALYSKFSMKMNPDKLLAGTFWLGSSNTDIWQSFTSNDLKTNRRLEDMHSIDIEWKDKVITRVLYDLAQTTINGQNPGVPKKT